MDLPRRGAVKHGRARRCKLRLPLDVDAKTNYTALQEPWLTTTLNPSFGERSDERRSLDFWLCNTGPTLANYGPNFDFWCQLIPTRAWQSEVIRHLVVATSMIDEQLGVYRTATSSKVGPEVIWHYHAAIKRMAGAKNPEKSCLVLASLLAWVCETLLKNYSSANIHINAATRLLSELETSSTGLDQTTRDFMVQCRPMLGLSASYVKVVCENTVPPENSQTAAFTNINGHKVHEIPVLESLTQIRDLGFDMIYLYLSTTQTRYDAWMQRVNVKNWHMAMRVYCSRSKLESNLYKNCVQLLFNLGLSFLPESEAGHFSQHATPNPTNHAIIALERIMVENEKNKVGSDRALVEDTIQKALRLIAGHVHDDDIRRRAVLLLGKLAVKAQASEHAEGLSIRNLQRS